MTISLYMITTTVMVDNIKLICLVHHRRPLWDATCKNYQNREMARQLWQEIGVELDNTIQTVKMKWQNLRDTFRKEYRKCSRENAPQSTWKFYKQLLFLVDGFCKKDLCYGTDTSESSFKMQKLVDVKKPDALNQLKSLDQTQTNQLGKVYSRRNSLKLKDIKRDEDYYFLMSLLPYLRDVPKRRKLATRIRLQQVLLEESKQEKQSPNASESSFGNNAVSPPSPNAMQGSPNDTQLSLVLFCQSDPMGS
ncbi:unnamed protein product [Lymnaea stagnalis]|uniref:MADF domain-containing protein n=1 Tax=Lymnaea stagnalis TaxID=6523 RepID=A0AAV2ILU8_LYMST